MKQIIDFLKVSTLCLSIFLAPGCGKQTGGVPHINGVVGPIFNVVDGQILMTLKLLNLQVDAGFKIPVPKTRNSFLEFSPNIMDGGMMLQIYMDADDLSSIDIGLGDGNYLPDGRAVPGIPGGRLDNSLRVDTEWNDISFYYHQKLFGLWVPVGFDTAGISGYWNVTINQKRVGLLGIVGGNREENLRAGGIILLNLEALRNPQLKALIDLSKNNPGVVF